MRKLRLIGPIRPIRLIGLISLIGPIGLIGLMSILASCSKDSVEEPEPLLQEVISFSGELQDDTDITAGTRAESETPLSDLVHSFQVWAFKNKGITEAAGINYTNPQCVIPGYTVTWAANSAYTTTTNSSGWEYVDGGEQTIKYWDLDAKAYKFFGYVQPTIGSVEAEFFNTTTGTDGAYETYGANGTIDDYSECRFSFAADALHEDEAPYFSRLWFSNNAPECEHFYPSIVRLQFFKPFTKVRFMFKLSKTDEPILIEMPHFFPSNPERQIVLSGTFTITYPLTGTGTKETWVTEHPTYSMTAFTQEWYTMTDEEISDAEDSGTEEDLAKIANKEHWYTVLPIRDQGAYTLTVRVNGEERTCYVPGEYMNWLPGYSYTYIFKVNEEGGIEIDAINVAFTDWLGNEEQEKKVFNW